MPTDLANSVKQFAETVRDVLRNPQADPRQTILIVGILTVAVALVVMILLIIILFLGGGRQRRKLRVPKKTGAYRGLVLAYAILALLVFLSLGSLYVYSSKPSTCAMCHPGNRIQKSLAESEHRGQPCLTCHQEPGGTGFLVQAATYLRWTSQELLGTKSRPEAYVSNASCARCHLAVYSNTVVRNNIRVSHREFLEEGQLCTDCHGETGHKEDREVTGRSSMTRCVICHDGKRASAECGICHAEGKQRGLTSARRDFARIDIPMPSNCRSCHKVQTNRMCIKCHGLEMPHPANWKDGATHAGLAFTKKELCWKCHTPPKGPPTGHLGLADTTSLCNRCHSFPSPHGSEARWIKLHGPAALGTAGVREEACYGCHDRSTDPVVLCDKCHGRSKNFCDLCHTGLQQSASD